MCRKNKKAYDNDNNYASRDMVKLEYRFANIGSFAPRAAGPLGCQVQPVIVPVPLVPYVAEDGVVQQMANDEE